MHNVYTSIFSVLDKYKYCVLRNSDGLPLENNSNDIDLLIEENHYTEILSKITEALIGYSYSRVESSSFYGIKCYTFYSVDKKIEPVKLDFFFEFCGGGLHYINFDSLYDKTILNNNGIRVLEPNFESFINTLKTYLSGGILKDKYIQGLNKASIDGFCDDFEYLGDVIEDIKQAKNGNTLLKGRRKIYIKQILKSNLKSIGIIATVSNITRHLKSEVSRLTTKKRLVVICGIDGSGKSTLLDECFKESPIHFKSIKDRFIFEHHSPRMLPHISDLIKGNKKSDVSSIDIHENPRSGKVKGRLISTIKFFYYLIDYSIMFRIKHSNQLRRDKIIIYDRYYFDFLVDPERSALNVAPGLVKIAYKILVPKPSVAIYVTVPPELAFERKGELTISESKFLQDKYLENKDFWSKNVVVNNIELKESVKQFREAFIIGITDDIGDDFVK